MRIPLTAITIIIIGMTLSAHAQSLADLAKKEKERRENVKTDSKVIGNKDTSRYKNGPVTTGSVSAPAAPEKSQEPQKAAPAPESPAKAVRAESDEPADLFGRPESFWRQTFSDARQRLKELENQASVSTLKINDLRNKFYSEADGFKQQQIDREIQKAIYEQDLNKENLSKASVVLQDLEKEARKSGALPGWIAPKTP